VSERASPTDGDGDAVALSLGPRTLPPPGGASDVLRDAVAASSPLERRQELQVVPQNEAEWLAFVAAVDGQGAAEVRSAVDRLPVAVVREQIEGVDVYHVTPDEIDPVHEDHLFVHVHGGAYVLGGGEACTSEALLIALGTRMAAVSIDYRMAPRHPYPAAVDDVVAVYRHLLTQRSARSMAMGGSSAGGGITMASVQRLIELGTDTPGALFLGTPGSDLTGTGDTFHTNEDVDRNIPVYEGFIEAAVKLYAGGLDLTDPRISPIYGDVDGFPPTLLVSGTRDAFLSNTVRTHIKLREAGGVADLLVYEGMSHGDYLHEYTSPETRHWATELSGFLAQHLRRSSRPAPPSVPRMESTRWT